MVAQKTHGKHKKRIQMRISLLLLLVFTMFPAKGQEISIKCDCTSFIHWKNVDTSTFNGNSDLEKLFRTEVLCDNDEYMILRDSSDYFLIKRTDYAKSKTDTFIISQKPVWIKKQGIVCTYTQHDPNQIFTIYSQPDLNSEKLFERRLVVKEFGTLMIIKNCIKDWLKVMITINGKRMEGWIKKVNSCPLKCTTCT